MGLMDKIGRIKAISSLLDDDDPDKIEMLNIEGSFEDLMKWALMRRNEHIATANAAKELSDKYKARQASFANKADNLKGIIESIMNAANEKKYSCELGTVGFRNIPPKPVVQDESLIPKKYFKTSEILQKAEINKAIKAGEKIKGVIMDNGSTSLSIRV